MYIVKKLASFDNWLLKLKDRSTKIRLIRRLDKAKQGLLGDVKPVGEGVYEMREFFGPGWRMYYIHQGNSIILMLGGGDKSTQPKDVKRAIELSKSLGELNDE